MSPPLTPEQVDRLRALLEPARAAQQSHADLGLVDDDNTPDMRADHQ
jgi:hypothetical protein